MKVAFCISGQIRGDDGHFAAIRAAANELNAKVFFSTWRQRGVKTSGAQNIHQLPRMFGVIFSVIMPERFVGRQAISRAFPNFESDIQAKISNASNVVNESVLQDFFADSVIDIEDSNNFSLDFDIRTDDNNSLRMLYKIWKCNELKRAYEKSHGVIFDAVVRFRPDIVPRLGLQDIAKNILLHEKQVLYAENVKEFYISDQISLSSSQVADYYSSLFGKALLAPNRRWKHIHRELFDHLIDANVELRQCKLGDGIRASETQQRQSREVLLNLFDQENVSQDFVSNPKEIQSVGFLLKAANELENDNPQEAESYLRKIDYYGTNRELLESHHIANFIIACSKKDSLAAANSLISAILSADRPNNTSPQIEERYKILGDFYRKAFGLTGEKSIFETDAVYFNTLQNIPLPSYCPPKNAQECDEQAVALALKYAKQKISNI